MAITDKLIGDVTRRKPIVVGSRVAPSVIKERIEGIIARTGISMPRINIRQEAHEIDIPAIKIEAPVPVKVPAPAVCEAKLVASPSMVKIDEEFNFEFSVKNCGDAPGDFEIIVVLSKTGAAAMTACLDANPVAQLYGAAAERTYVPYDSSVPAIPAYGVSPPHELCGPNATYPTFNTIIWGILPGATKQVTIPCRISKEFTGRAKLNVRAWARLVVPEPGT